MVERMEASTVELVFVVRMWLQGGDVAGVSRWRGDVLDVCSGLRHYIVSAAESPSSSMPGWKSIF